MLLYEEKYHLKYLPGFKWDNVDLDTNIDVKDIPTNGFGTRHLYYSFIQEEGRVLHRMTV